MSAVHKSIIFTVKDTLPITGCDGCDAEQPLPGSLNGPVGPRGWRGVEEAMGQIDYPNPPTGWTTTQLNRPARGAGPPMVSFDFCVSCSADWRASLYRAVEKMKGR